MSTDQKARLQVLGGAALHGERGPVAGRTAQRRRIALLAILAVHRRGVSRDKLVGYLWEEADTDRARRVLSESIYVIRKALGEDAILAAGDELRLNSDVVTSDVGDFMTALESGDLERAAEVYDGPLLDGFFVDDAAEFEQWSARERLRLSQEFEDVLRKLAERAGAAGDNAAAVRWWRRLAEQNPFSAAPATGLMRALAAAGERAAALAHARTHAARLHSEFDAPPDEQVEACAQELRDVASPPVMPARRDAVTNATIVADGTSPAETTSPAEATSRAETMSHAETTTAEPSVGREALPRRAWMFAAILIVSVAAWFIVGMLSKREPAAIASADKVLVAVLPFSAKDDPQMATDLARLLASGLDGAGNVYAVPANNVLSRASRQLTDGATDQATAARIAQNIGAHYFVQGFTVSAGSEIAIHASIYGTGDPQQSLGDAVARGPVDDLFDLSDSLTLRLLRNWGHGGNRQLNRMALLGTRSVPAAKQWMQGEDFFLEGEYGLAAAAFARAVALDPEYALAHYRLSAAHEWNFDFTAARNAAERASALNERLPAQYQPLLAAWNDFLDGRADVAQMQYETLIASAPHDLEALSGLAEVLVHFNPLRGMRAADAREQLDRVLAISTSYGEARFHAMEFAARDNNRVTFDSLFSTLKGSSAQDLAWRAVKAFTWGTPREQTAVLSALRRDDLATGLAAGRLAAHTHNFAAAERVARQLANTASAPVFRAGALLLTAQTRLAAGDWPGAEVLLISAGEIERDWTRELTALYLLHPDVQAPRDRLLQEVRRLEEWQPVGAHTTVTSFFFGAHALVHPVLRHYLIGLLNSAAGEKMAAQVALDSLIRYSGDEQAVRLANGLTTSLRGHILRADGNPGESLERLRSVILDARPEFIALSPFYSRAYDRLVMAELYADAGEHQRAIAWYSSLLDGFDFVYARAAHQRLAALYRTTGDAAASALHDAEVERLGRK